MSELPLADLWRKRKTWDDRDWASFYGQLSRCLWMAYPKFQHRLVNASHHEEKEPYQDLVHIFIADRVMGFLNEQEEVNCAFFLRGFEWMLMDMFEKEIARNPGAPSDETVVGSDEDGEGEEDGRAAWDRESKDAYFERMYEEEKLGGLLPGLASSLPKRCQEFLDGLPSKRQPLYQDLLRCHCREGALSRLKRCYGSSYNYQGELLGVVVVRDRSKFPESLLGRWLTQTLGPAAPGGAAPEQGAIAAALGALCRAVAKRPRNQPDPCGGDPCPEALRETPAPEISKSG